jgi:hypothetical protein
MRARDWGHSCNDDRPNKPEPALMHSLPTNGHLGRAELPHLPETLLSLHAPTMSKPHPCSSAAQHSLRCVSPPPPPGSFRNHGAHFPGLPLRFFEYLYRVFSSFIVVLFYLHSSLSIDRSTQPSIALCYIYCQCPSFEQALLSISTPI